MVFPLSYMEHGAAYCYKWCCWRTLNLVLRHYSCSVQPLETLFCRRLATCIPPPGTRTRADTCEVPSLSKNVLKTLNGNWDFLISSAFFFFKYQIRETDMKSKEEEGSEGAFFLQRRLWVQFKAAPHKQKDRRWGESMWAGGTRQQSLGWSGFCFILGEHCRLCQQKMTKERPCFKAEYPSSLSEQLRTQR